MTDNRRPLASRDTKLAARAARWLADSRITPNQISQASVVFAALSGIGFWASGSTEGAARIGVLLLAALGCQIRLACNLLDGMVAIEGGKSAPDGLFWNEAPDRVSDILILVGMGLGAGTPTLGWAAAALAVLTAYIRELGTLSDLASDFSGPMAKPQRMAVATGTAVIATAFPTLGEISLLILALWLITVGSAATALRRSRQIVKSLHAR